jgi:hypothetical protein
MARLNVFRIDFDTRGLDGLAKKLDGLDPESIGRLMVDAINETADTAYDLGRRAILQGINLTDAYVQRKMEVRYATAKNPEASIVAFGGNKFTTALSHYGAMQLTAKDNWTNDRIRAAGHQFSAWPGWTRRTGNAALGIAVDRKAAGKTVEVIKGVRKKLGPIFSIPGKTDNDGDLLLFRRTPEDKVQSLQGPSVYQLFRVAIPQIYDEVEEDLASSVLDAAEREFTKALS